LLKEFVNLYDKTKGIHKRLNGRRLHQLTRPASGTAGTSSYEVPA